MPETVMPSRAMTSDRRKSGAKSRSSAALAQAGFPGSAALRAFEAAGRLLSFKKAAQELKVTESAISFQIRQLERDLGLDLFERGHRQIKLTPAARAYLAVVRQAHREIADATLSLAARESLLVRISLVPALAEFWLVPQLGALRRALPDVAIAVMTSSDLADLDRDEIDIAIRYGAGAWPRARIEPLLEEYIVPVAHPDIARQLGSRSIAAAAEIPLILNLQHPDEWSSWQEARRQRGGLAIGREMLRLETSGLVLQAAMEQLGIAIGRRPFIDRFLERGDLVALSDRDQPSGKGYFILTPLGRRGLRSEITAVADFLRSRASAAGAAIA
ncbi:MAG TPA: LysR substrate-binding domain-containing protein [Terriglobales bacterium]|nr:LysR substrate-binding domain-containing protein [Terriglobales bacterium]